MYNEKDTIAQWNADMYDLNETYTDDVEFALSLIGTSRKKILEIACGSGRFLIPMVDAGHDVTGLDYDDYMLAKIPEKAANKKVKYYKADAIYDDWGSGFDAVILGGNFLYNIVSDMDYEQAQRLMIQKAAKALVLGGHVFIDCGYTQHPEEWFNNPNDNLIWEGKDKHGNYGKMILRNSIYNAENRINTFIRRIEMVLADGNDLVKEIPSRKHFASLEQIHKWLAESGFIVEQEYGDYKGNLIGEKTHRAIIWAKRV